MSDFENSSIVVAAGNERFFELQTATVVPEDSYTYENGYKEPITRETLLLRDGRSLVPAAHSLNGHLRAFALDYESVEDSLVGPLLHTQEMAEEERFRRIIGHIEETPDQLYSRLVAERRMLQPSTDRRLGLRSRSGYWIRLNAGPFSEPLPFGKTIAARVAFFSVEAKLNGVVPVIYDESGVDDMYDAPKQFVMPNPWLYVASDRNPLEP